MAGASVNELLQHPAIWRGGNAARIEAISTGFGKLDECLPGQGWPRAGLAEILIPRLGGGELKLLLPLLAAMTGRTEARWCVWVAPPFEPYAPALAAQGVSLDRILVVRAREPLWALEQALGLGASDIVLAWVRQAHQRDLRRLQLAAERGHALGVLFRDTGAAQEASPAMLRLMIEPVWREASRDLRITILKSRGGYRGSIRIESV